MQPPEEFILRSTYRESVVEHLFLGKLLPLYWKANPSRPIEVSKPLVDDAGYDLILEVPNIVRHVQLKGSFCTSRKNPQNVHERLWDKQSGCVVWIIYNSKFKLKKFYWFGGEPNKPPPKMSDFKKQRTHVRIRKGAFKKLDINDVAKHLFGEWNGGSTMDTPDQNPDPESSR